MIKKTTDYNMFKKHESNRPLIKANLDKIRKSIQIKNLLEFRPILVNANMQIIDGQHRLEVAKELGLEIYYDVNKESEVADMYLLNSNQRRWGPEDYMNFYANEGNQNYKKLKDFMNRKNLSFSQATKLLYKFSNKSIEHRTETFNAGKFDYPTEAQVFESEEMLEKVKEIINYINQKLPGNNFYLKSGKFMMAITDFFLIYPVEFADFMRKLPYRLELIRPCGNREQYLNIFKEIYNYKNQNPIFD